MTKIVNPRKVEQQARFTLATICSSNDLQSSQAVKGESDKIPAEVNVEAKPDTSCRTDADSSTISGHPLGRYCKGEAREIATKENYINTLRVLTGCRIF